LHTGPKHKPKPTEIQYDQKSWEPRFAEDDWLRSLAISHVGIRPGGAIQ
jgi:hypothetical protein